MNPAVVAAGARNVRRHRAALITAALFAPCACGTMLTVGFGASGAGDWWMDQANAAQCSTSVAPGEQMGSWNPTQTGNAAVFVAIAQERGLPAKAPLVGVATSMQEAKLLNLASRAVPESMQYPNDGVADGDHDSVNLLQQRTSQGWGTIAQLMDVRYAVGKFYDALVLVPGWEQMPVWLAAQRVQRSALPLAYAQWEDDATALVAQLGVVPSSGGGCGGTVVGGYALPLPKDKIVPPLRPHHDYPAVDIPVPEGTPVYAITGGTVRAFVEAGGCGNGVAVTDAGGNEWMYCHSSQVLVSGGPVNPGDQLSLSGTTGASTGPHLHVQLRTGGRLVCPQPVIEAVFAGQPAPAVESLPSSGCVG